MKKSTSELLDILKSTTDYTDYTEQNANELIEQIPLHQYLGKLLEDKSLKKSDVIRHAGLDRGYGYDIFTGARFPSRDKLLALLFAMKLSTEEVQTLLKLTGYPQLYARTPRDSAILFALQHSLSLTDTNELLYEMNFACLD